MVVRLQEIVSLSCQLHGSSDSRVKWHLSVSIQAAVNAVHGWNNSQDACSVTREIKCGILVLLKNSHQVFNDMPFLRIKFILP